MLIFNFQCIIIGLGSLVCYVMKSMSWHFYNFAYTISVLNLMFYSTFLGIALFLLLANSQPRPT